MPFDPTKPYEVVAEKFDPARPYEITPRFDPNQPFDVVKGAARDTARDSYEAQLEDIGLTPQQAAAATRQSDRQAELFAAQQAARRTGEYWEGVGTRIDALETNVVEPLTRPLSGAVGRAADVVVPGPPVIEPVIQQGGIHLPRAGEATSTGGKVAAGLYNAAAELLSAFTNPDVVALLPAAANKTVLTAWISQMAGHQPERVLKAAQLFKAGKLQEGVQEVAMGGGELLMAELGRRHVMGADGLKPGDVNGAPRVNINERGEAVDAASPDLIARNVAAPGTLRPQEQRGAVAPAAERPPEMVQFERVPLFNRAGEVVDVQVVPRIREIVFEDPQIIEPVPRFIKPDVEGGMLPERRQGFERTAEDFIEARLEGNDQGPMTKAQGEPVLERPSRTIEETTAPAAEAMAAPEQPAKVLTDPPTGRTVMKAAASETITRPGKPGNEGTASEILAEREKRPRPKPPQADRPWDIIDEIEGEIGGTIDPGLIRELDPNWKPVGVARKLFSRGGRGADQVLNALTYKGDKLGLRKDMGLQEFAEAINAAARARQQMRARSAAERRKLDELGREAQTRGQFEKKVILGERPKAEQNNVQQVRVDNLVVGDRFKVQDHKFEITKMLTDEDGNLVSVTLKDGPKFGVQTVGDVGTIHIDKGSLRKNRQGRDVWSVPAEAEQMAPAAEVPKLKSNQNQGDLLGSGDVEFNLYGEKGADGARIAAERLKAEETHQAAEDFAAKHQPGLISGTAAEAWADRTIARSKTLGITPNDPNALFAAYVVKGAAHLERGIRKFSDWSRKMIAEHGDVIRPHLRRVFEESQRAYSRTAEDLNGLRQRKLAARGSQSKAVPAEHRERMRTGQESFYEPQDMGRVEDVVARMTSDELASVPLVEVDGPQNIGIAAKLESYRRLVAADQLDAAWKVIEDTMKMGTSLGQLVNQFKLLRGATPDGVMVMLNKQLLAGGFDPVPPVEAIRIRRLAEESIKANARWKEAERVWKEAPTEQNFQQVETLQSDAIAADSLLRERLRRYEPRTLGGTLSTLFKGNLIAPISQARNVVGNTVNLAARGGVRNIAVALDAVDAALRSRPRTRALVPLRGTKEAVKAIGRSLPQSLEVLRRGGSEVDLGKADARVGLRPLVALREAILADVMGPKRNGKTPIAQRLLAGLEATPFGMHAAAQLRTLGAVDKPFKSAARARLVTEAMKVQDLNRKQRISALRKDPSPEAQVERQALERMRIYTSANVAKAVKFPELFLDAETVARIDGEAAAAVYQQRNPLASRFSRALSGVSPMTRFWVDTIVPFVTTPSNVIGEWLSYAPPVALYNLGRHAWRGESRQATQAAGKFVVGSMAFLAGQWLYNKGLVSPTLDQSDEQQKARILSGQSMPAGRLNVTGLERSLQGHPGGWQPGDVTVDVLSAGGVLGAVFQTVADVNRRTETQPEEPGAAEKAGIFGANYVQMTAGYGVQQSFLKGTATLLEALMSPQKTENWLATYLDSLSAMALPNTMTAISRATREAKPELRGDSLDERLNNQIKNRIAGVQRLAGGRGAEADLPLKRDLWGRPIPETPEGSNAYLAHFLDVTKGQRVANDPVALHLYSLWRRTSDLAVIPTPPDSNFSIAGKQFDPLTRGQVDDLQEIVGGIRYKLAGKLMDNPRFYLAPAGEQISALKMLWSLGNQMGGIEFYKRHSGDLQSRREKAGFVPE